MEIIDDISAHKDDIFECIKKYGCVREHNFWFFYNYQYNYAKARFLKFENDCGILTIRYKSGLWEMLGEVLAPENKKLEFFSEFLDYILNIKKDKKFFICAAEKFFNQIKNAVEKSNRYRITSAPIVYYTPVFDLEKWNEELSGGEWKKLRNIKNKFQKSFDVDFIPAKEADKQKLIEVVHQWRENRSGDDKIYHTQLYINFIKNNFEGADIATAVVLNGEPCCIFAGWSIPNSHGYHSSIGLYNYKYGSLAEFANIEELNQAKSKGYKHADFGDSNEGLLQFKKKFKPKSIYKTYWFHIVKK